MRHKWIMVLVVLITTVVTAQEVVKQYDDLKAQAGAWATSRLWASFLSTNAAEEESLGEPAVTCSVKAITNDPSPQQETLMPVQVNEVKSVNNGQQRAEASHTTRTELPALKDKQHNDSSPTGEVGSEHSSEVALLTEQEGLEMEEPGQPETQQTTETDTDVDDEKGDHSIDYAEREASLVSRNLNNVAVQEALRAVDASLPLRQTIAASDVRAKAIKRAIKALQDSFDRDRRIELRIIRRQRRVDTQNGTSISLRTQVSSNLSATDFQYALLPTQTNSQPVTSLSADGSCASEE